MRTADILVIGGGPAGLTTAGALRHVGLETTILDGGERIGQSWEQRYDRLHLHTVRSFSGLAHFPIPRRYPKYLSKDEYASYLRDYAAHFNLHFEPNVHVQRVQPSTLHGSSTHKAIRWAVDTQGETWLARVVVIAAGRYRVPVCPDWPGLDRFSGRKLHSAQFKSGSAFRGQRVLIIGAGNTGMEIAADCVENEAAKVGISLRSAPPIVPRDFLGTPAQVFALLMYSLPPGVSDGIGKRLSRLALGDLSRYGLPPADWLPFSSRRTPVIDVGFVPALKAGRVGIRPVVQSFTSSGVIFADQHEEAFDAVVFATGFRSGLEELLEPAGLLNENGAPRFPSAAPTSCPGLYFVGYNDALRGLLYESNLASRRLAQHLKVGI